MKQTTIRLPADLDKALGHYLVDTGQDMQPLVIRLLREEIARQGPPDGLADYAKRSQKVPGTESAISPGQTGTINTEDDVKDRTMLSGRPEVDDQKEILSSEPIDRTSSSIVTIDARTAATLEGLKGDVRDLRNHFARIEQLLSRLEKPSAKVDRVSRVVPRRKRKHPPSSQSGT